MTKEEAISIMKVIVHMLEEKYDTDRVEEAVDMAIEALEQKPICQSAGVDCEDCPAYEDAISRKAVTDALCSDCELYKDGKRTCFMKCEEYHFLTTLPPVVTKEERALLQRWRDNRGVSMEEFAKALELLEGSDKE